MRCIFGTCELIFCHLKLFYTHQYETFSGGILILFYYISLRAIKIYVNIVDDMV